MTLGLAVIFKNFENFTCFSLFFTLNSSTETNSGIHQNVCRSRCLFIPLYLTIVLALLSAATYLPNKTLIFHDSPGLENKILTFHDFPGFSWPGRTLYYLTFFNVACVWLGNLYLDFETQIIIWILQLQEIWKQKSVFKVDFNSRFGGFPSLPFNWEIQKRNW